MKTFNQFLDEGVLTSIGKKKPEKKAEKAMDAGAIAKRKLARAHHAKYVSGSEDLVPDDIREGMIDVIKKGAKRHSKAVEKKKIKNRKAVPYAALAAQHEPEGEIIEAKVDAGKSPEQKEKDRNVRKFGVSHNVAGHGKLRRALHRSDRGDKKIKGDKSQYVEMESAVNEGIGRAIKKGVKIAKRVVKDAGPYDPGGYTSIGSLGNPHLGNEKKRAKERAAKRGVSEAKVDDVKYSKDEKRKNYETDVHTLSVNKGVRTDRNKRHSATDVAFKGHAATHRDRMQKHYKSRGVKTKGMKEDKAFNYVLGKLKDKYGSAVMTKGDKMPEPSAAQKKKNDAIRAKRAKEDHRDPTEKASDGRYSDRYSNRGSD